MATRITAITTSTVLSTATHMAKHVLPARLDCLQATLKKKSYSLRAAQAVTGIWTLCYSTKNCISSHMNCFKRHRIEPHQENSYSDGTGDSGMGWKNPCHGCHQSPFWPSLMRRSPLCGLLGFHCQEPATRSTCGTFNWGIGRWTELYKLTSTTRNLSRKRLFHPTKHHSKAEVKRKTITFWLRSTILLAYDALSLQHPQASNPYKIASILVHHGNCTIADILEGSFRRMNTVFASHYFSAKAVENAVGSIFFGHLHCGLPTLNDAASVTRRLPPEPPPLEECPGDKMVMTFMMLSSQHNHFCLWSLEVWSFKPLITSTALMLFGRYTTHVSSHRKHASQYTQHLWVVLQFTPACRLQ